MGHRMFLSGVLLLGNSKVSGSFSSYLHSLFVCWICKRIQYKKEKDKDIFKLYFFPGIYDYFVVK